MNAPILSSDTVYSQSFLDVLRDQLHEWSLTLFDPQSGGFRCNKTIGPNVLSTTDIAWIRYANNDSDPGAPNRDKIVAYLQAKQNPKTGMIAHDPGSAGRLSDGHAFWHTVRALYILNAQLPHFPVHLKPMLTPLGLNAWFDQFDWDGFTDECRGNHHEILSLIPAIVSLADNDLTEALYHNIGKQQNPTTGTWPRAKTNISRTFAYTAIHRASGKMPQQPEAIIDEIIHLQNENGLWDAHFPGFSSMDSAYLLVRLPQHLKYREDDATACLQKLSDAMRHIFATAQPQLLNNTHRMLAITHTFGLLQEVFPDVYPSEKPYRFDWDKLDMYACDVITHQK